MGVSGTAVWRAYTSPQGAGGETAAENVWGVGASDTACHACAHVQHLVVGKVNASGKASREWGELRWFVATQPSPPSARTPLPRLCSGDLFSQATAVMYLKRFYLYNSCINYPPMRIMLTCVYLAGKVRAPGAGEYA